MELKGEELLLRPARTYYRRRVHRRPRILPHRIYYAAPRELPGWGPGSGAGSPRACGPLQTFHESF